MATFDQLFLPGHAKPLDEWSDRALAQTRRDLGVSIEHEHSGGGRRELSASLSLVDQELTRREGARSPGNIVRPETERRALAARRELQAPAEREADRDSSRDYVREEREPLKSPDRQRDNDSGLER